MMDGRQYRVRSLARDGAGNVQWGASSRTFTADGAAPTAPSITDTDPDSPANDDNPEVKGSADSGSTVRIYSTGACTGSPLATGTAATFGGTGITTPVSENQTANLRATATDAAGNTSGCSTALAYTEDSTAPQTQIDSGPQGQTNDATPSFGFSATGGATGFECRFDSASFGPCSGAGSHTPLAALADGAHSFEVRATDQAQNTDQSPASRPFTVETDADNDTVADGSDNCQTVANQNQANQDDDALGDACDPDRDGDAVANGSDNCADTPNPNQQNTDGDSQGDACDATDSRDDDVDGIANLQDNCPADPNPGQQNTDGDSEGDACDSDDDNDTVVDGSDSCRTLAASTPSGCPAAARSLTLSYSKSKRAFKGVLAAPESSCIGNDLVTVWKRVGGDDVKIGTDEVNGQGKYVLPKRGRPGKYYATVNELAVPACGSATSPILRLR